MHRKVIAASFCGAAVLAIGSIVIVHEISTSNTNDCARAEVLRLFLVSDAANKSTVATRAAAAATLRRRLANDEEDPIQQVVLRKDAARYAVSARESQRLATYWRDALIPTLRSSTCKLPKEGN